MHVLQLGCVVRHIGKSMVTFHLQPARGISFTRPDRCGQAHREVDGSMPPASTSLHVLQLGLTAWSGTSERRWFHAIGIHNVALLATRPSWSGTSESRWSHAIDIHTVACSATGPSWSGNRKVDGPMHRPPLRCMSCNSPDRRGQANRKVDGSMPSAYTVLQLGLTVVVRHIGKPMVPCHRHPHRCLSCTKGV